MNSSASRTDSGWTTLNCVATINPGKPKYLELDDDDLVGFIPMAAVDDVSGSVTVVEERQLRSVRNKSFRTFASGDVLFAKITPCMENGKSAVVPDLPNGHGFGSTEFHVLRPHDGIEADYLWHFLRQPSYRAEAEAHMTGSVGQLRVPVDFLRATPIYVPSPEEQRRVVARLNEIASGSGSAQRHVEAGLSRLAAFWDALLADACSGALTAEWRAAKVLKSVGDAPVLSPQGAKHASSAPNSDVLIEIPGHWSWWTVESITSEVIDYRGRTPPSEPVGPIPHVRTTQIRSGRIDWNTDRFVSEEVYNDYMTRGIPRRGDILFTMEAPLGEVGVVDRDEPFSLAQRILLMRPREDVDPNFLALVLRSGPVRRAIEFRATGSGVLGVAYKRLRSVKVPKPPLEEQQEIVRRVTELLVTAERAECRANAASRQIERAHNAAVRAAFSGELSVEDDNRPGRPTPVDTGRG